MLKNCGMQSSILGCFRNSNRSTDNLSGSRVPGFDPVWFGIIITRVSEIGVIALPLGINVYVMKGVATDVSLSTIFQGILPFLAADVV